MRAMILRQPSRDGGPYLSLENVPLPSPKKDELLVRVSVCGVCRTDLDIAEGRLDCRRYPLVPGHQVIGRVATAATSDATFREGDRVGIAWIHSADGSCRWCRAGTENLCPAFESTGCAVDGGYAEYVTVRAAFAHRIPDALPDVGGAPLLCAGAIGWRSLRLADPEDGEPLGLVGFGASGHLVLQLARLRHPGSPIFVFARDANELAFARELGAAWTGAFDDAPPKPLSAIIDTTPVWHPMVRTLRHLARGGRFVINAIRKTGADQQELARLDYARDLWMEREIRSVANVTSSDVREVLEITGSSDLRPTAEEIPLERANEALERVRAGGTIRGAIVLRVSPEG